MKLLWSNLSLGGLYTDANADDADIDDNDDTRQTEHDCIGSLPNEPISALVKSTCQTLILNLYERSRFFCSQKAWSAIWLQPNKLWLGSTSYTSGVFPSPCAPKEHLHVVIGVWIDTYVFYQSVLQKKRPEFGHCVLQRRNVIMLWCNVTSWRHVHGDGCLQTPVVYDYPFNWTCKRHVSLLIFLMWVIDLL